MATIRSYTTIEQSRKLAEILPLESADMFYPTKSKYEGKIIGLLDVPLYIGSDGFVDTEMGEIYAWSIDALLNYLSEIKPQVYTPVLFPSESKWILQFAEYSHGNVYEVSCDNPIDACVVMIEKLKELNLL
jgi:hypothetical protein